MLLARFHSVFGIFKNNVGETHTIFGFKLRSTDNAMVEGIVEVNAVGFVTNHYIVGIARDERVGHCEVESQRTVVGKSDGGTAFGVEGIKLRQCTLIDVHAPAANPHTVAQRVGKLAVAGYDCRMDYAQSGTLHVMQRAVFERKCGAGHIGRVAENAIVAAMDVGECYFVVKTAEVCVEFL